MMALICVDKRAYSLMKDGMILHSTLSGTNKPIKDIQKT